MPSPDAKLLKKKMEALILAIHKQVGEVYDLSLINFMDLTGLYQLLQSGTVDPLVSQQVEQSCKTLEDWYLTGRTWGNNENQAADQLISFVSPKALNQLYTTLDKVVKIEIPTQTPLSMQAKSPASTPKESSILKTSSQNSLTRIQLTDLEMQVDLVSKHLKKHVSNTPEETELLRLIKNSKQFINDVKHGKNPLGIRKSIFDEIEKSPAYQTLKLEPSPKSATTGWTPNNRFAQAQQWLYYPVQLIISLGAVLGFYSKNKPIEDKKIPAALKLQTGSYLFRESEKLVQLAEKKDSPNATLPVSSTSHNEIETLDYPLVIKSNTTFADIKNWFQTVRNKLLIERDSLVNSNIPANKQNKESDERLNELNEHYQAALLSKLSVHLGLSNHPQSYDLHLMPNNPEFKVTPNILYLKNLGKNGFQYKVKHDEHIITDTINLDQLAAIGITGPFPVNNWINPLKQKINAIINVLSSRGHAVQHSIAEVKKAFSEKPSLVDPELETGYELLMDQESRTKNRPKKEKPPRKVQFSIPASKQTQSISQTKVAGKMVLETMSSVEAKPLTVAEIHKKYQRDRDEILLATNAVTKKRESRNLRFSHPNVAESSALVKQERREKLKLLNANYQASLIARLGGLLELAKPYKLHLMTSSTKPVSGVVYVDLQQEGLQYTVKHQDQIITDVITPEQLTAIGLSEPLLKKNLLKQLQQKMNSILNIISNRDHTHQPSIGDVKKAFAETTVPVNSELEAGYNLLTAHEARNKNHQSHMSNLAGSVSTQPILGGNIDTAQNVEVTPAANKENTFTISPSTTFTDLKNKYQTIRETIAVNKINSPVNGTEPGKQKAVQVNPVQAAAHSEEVHQLNTNYQKGLITKLSAILGLTGSPSLAKVKSAYTSKKTSGSSDPDLDNGFQLLIESEQLLAEPAPIQTTSNRISQNASKKPLIITSVNAPSSTVPSTNNSKKTEPVISVTPPQSSQTHKSYFSTFKEKLSNVSITFPPIFSTTKKKANTTNEHSEDTDVSLKHNYVKMDAKKIESNQENIDEEKDDEDSFDDIEEKRTGTQAHTQINPDKKSQQDLEENDDGSEETHDERVQNHAFRNRLADLLKDIQHPDGWTSKINVHGEDHLVIEHSDKNGSRLPQHDITVAEGRVSAVVSLKASGPDMEHMAKTMFYTYIAAGGNPTTLDLEQIKHPGMKLALEEVKRTYRPQDNSEDLYLLDRSELSNDAEVSSLTSSPSTR